MNDNNSNITPYSLEDFEDSDKFAENLIKDFAVRIIEESLAGKLNGETVSMTFSDGYVSLVFTEAMEAGDDE
jgi:peptidoglycan/xylan/chitin deacetylase (PgdA/CDA1 family)